MARPKKRIIVIDAQEDRRAGRGLRMTYHPIITTCPVCKALKSPMATVCAACYLEAKRDPEVKVNSTGDLEVWLLLQKEKRGATPFPASSIPQGESQ